MRVSPGHRSVADSKRSISFADSLRGTPMRVAYPNRWGWRSQGCQHLLCNTQLEAGSRRASGKIIVADGAKYCERSNFDKQVDVRRADARLEQLFCANSDTCD